MSEKGALGFFSAQGRRSIPLRRSRLLPFYTAAAAVAAGAAVLVVVVVAGQRVVVKAAFSCIDQ